MDEQLLIKGGKHYYQNITKDEGLYLGVYATIHMNVQSQKVKFASSF